LMIAAVHPKSPRDYRMICELDQFSGVPSGGSATDGSVTGSVTSLRGAGP
jgi:hypothetical protein